ncbi:uncharacterized protein wu:fc17b08 [Megalops cyprinoides]|uniref:uncharacterized protein wu:fc17b08 n=1 Tax=Megalops cyprinoides TaxID=118141 RepID=UPI001864E081|nr:uncharacterized protein wu:fc17b08 [Megalops cyprinoides]
MNDSLDLSLAKVRDLQSTSTLEQFMAKLCLHHQRQIVDALGFLQTEVKAVASTCSPEPSASKATLEALVETDCSPVPEQESAGLSCAAQRATAASSSAKTVNDLLEAASPRNAKPWVPHQNSESAGPVDASGEVCPSQTWSDPLDLRKAASGDGRGSEFFLGKASERDKAWQEDLLLPEKKNVSSSNLVEVKKLCMLESSCHTPVGTLDERQCNPETLLHPNRDEPSLEELSPSFGRHDQLFDHLYHTEQRGSSGRTKDLLVKTYPIKVTSKTTPPVSPRTARKSRRGPYPRPRDAVCQIINDPDSHCDIVYISKPITECELRPPNRMFPRRNARKSIRGHMYIEECYELKTVRTLSRRSATSDKGNCPAPVVETITLVTPKQALSKPDSVPPVDVPFAGGCGETFGQKAPSEQPMEKEIAGDVVEPLREAHLMVETSQTGQPPFREQTPPRLQNLPSLVHHESTEPEKEGEQQLQEEEEVSQAEKPPSPCLIEGVQHDKDNEHGLADMSTKEVIGPVQANDASPDPTVASADEPKSSVASEEEIENCSSPPQSGLKPVSPLTAAEDAVDTESTRVGVVESCEMEKQDELPVGTDQALSENVEKETLVGNEENVEKENFPEQDIGTTDPVFSTANDDVMSEETSKDADVEKVEVAVVEELSSVTDSHFEHAEKDGLQGEVASVAPEIAVTKKVSSRDIAPSDRCLRRRLHANSPESARLSKPSQETPGQPQVQSPESDLRISASTRSHRSVKVKPPEADTSSSRTVPPSTEEPVDKPQSSSEAMPSISKVVDNMVQTRHKAMLAKQLENSGGSQDTIISPSKAGLSTETDGLNASNKLTPPKEKATTTPVDGVVAGNVSEASTGNVLEKSRKAPLMRERISSGAATRPMSSATLMKHKKLVLRSQRSATLLATASRGKSEQKQVDCTFKARAEKTTPSQKRDFDPFGLQKLDLSAPNPPKFLEALRGEENQLQITSLNTKYDKMQRGWVQLDKEGQPAPRPRNRADRLKEIWKSKRRIRKPRPLDQQRYSPVQMLFMKTFDLTSICRWFLQTTETKSLVIVKKVNTRLPSETQLCFHSSSGVAGSSHGVFPSLQAERLKKHLKKFAVASPVKSNARNQKLIAKAWEQDSPCSKGKEKIKEMTSATRISTKPYSNPRKTQAQPVESQKAAAKSPASARILRKYTNIREKLHGQQHTLKPKEVTEGDSLKSTCVKPSVPAKLISKPKALPEQAKVSSTGKSSGKEPNGSKNSKAQSPPSSKREALNRVIKETGAKSGSSKLLMTLNRNDPRALKRAPPSVAAVAAKLRKPPAGAGPASPKLKQRIVMPRKVNAKAAEVQKAELVKAVQPKAGDPKAPAKTAVKSKPPENLVGQQPRADANPLPSQDQVLTRSQRKMEATPPVSGPPKPAAKRTQDLAQTPAKRTRLSLLK